jgi:hypothetical protein
VALFSRGGTQWSDRLGIPQFFLLADGDPQCAWSATPHVTASMRGLEKERELLNKAGLANPTHDEDRAAAGEMGISPAWAESLNPERG